MSKDEQTDATGSSPQAVSRREFARRAALAAAGITMTPGSSVTGALKNSNLRPEAEQQPSSKVDLSPAAEAEVESKIQFIFQKYGSRLSDAQKADIRRLVSEGQKPLEKLRAYTLENSDAPALVLSIEGVRNRVKD